ncbi:MAG: hypothetical protein RL432_1791 [Bacteroidota bacterium]|jgi:hypothetical protein
MDDSIHNSSLISSFADFTIYFDALGVNKLFK